MGAGGTLGQAFTKICAQRELPYRTLTHAEMDVTDPVAVEAQIERLRPWAIINAAGFVRVDDAETEWAACERANTLGPATVAAACGRAGVKFLTFSSDLVFDGTAECPYVESSPPCPLSSYGQIQSGGGAARRRSDAAGADRANQCVLRAVG